MEPPASAECLSPEVLGAWVGGLLPPADFARVEAHVAGCAACLHRVGLAARDDRARPLDSTLVPEHGVPGRGVPEHGVPGHGAEQALSFPGGPSAADAHALGTWVEAESWAEASRAAEPGALPPEVLGGRYELIARIARGGMGEVYRGRDRVTGTEVAIKRLKSGGGAADAELIARFTREAEILRRLNHPNIVQMLDIVPGRGVPARGVPARGVPGRDVPGAAAPGVGGQDAEEHHSIIMEYVPGGSLRRELVRQTVLPQVEALLLTLEVADALAQAHRLDVIHRDVKPENVLLARDGTVRLSDFGLARIGERSFTAPGTVLGTVAYLSPEVLWGHEVDARTDLWSLGVMLFEMLSGVRPFVASSPGATLTAILQQPVPELAAFCPSASPGLVELTHRMLQKDREQRISSSAEVSSAVESLLESLSAEP
ncbi:MAG: protein kinase [Deltaproteobacteria bacterium]